MIRWLWILTLILLGCSPSEKVSGVDSNTNFIQGTLTFVGEDGSAAIAGVPVYLWSDLAPTVNTAPKMLHTALDWSSQPPKDSTKTDSNGHYRFKNLSQGSYRIQSYVGDSLLFQETIVLKEDSPVTLAPQELQIPYVQQVVLENFETEDRRLLASWFHDAANWKGLFPSEDRVTLFPQTVRNQLETAVESCDSLNHCAHFSAALVDSGAHDNLNVHYNMLRPYKEDCIELPTAQVLRVRAKGQGTLYIGIWLMDSAGKNTYHSSISDLQTNWQTQQMDLQELYTQVDPSQRCIHKVLIGLKGPGEIWWDDLVMEGVSLVDFR